MREEVFVLCAVGADAHIRPCVFPTAAKRAMRFVGAGLRARPFALPNFCEAELKLQRKRNFLCLCKNRKKFER